jgi:hypothetical protein
MSFNFSRLRQEIADALKTIEGLHVSAYRTSPMLQTPCAFVIPDSIIYGITLPRQNQKSYFNIQLLIGRQKDLTESQSELDDYLSYIGDKSIFKAVGTYTYTEINHVHVSNMTQYGGFLYDDVPYWGALFQVETY